MRRGYQRLSPQAIDVVWVRLRAGNAVRPTASALGFANEHGADLSDPVWWDPARSSRSGVWPVESGGAGLGLVRASGALT